MKKWLNQFVLFCVLLAPGLVSAQQVDDPPTDCEIAARVIDNYGQSLAELFLKVNQLEHEVGELEEAYRDAIDSRVSLAKVITFYVQLSETRSLTQDEAAELARLLLQQKPLDDAIKSAKSALEECQRELDAAKSMMLTLARIRGTVIEWFEQHCDPVPVPNPVPNPDPNFP